MDFAGHGQSDHRGQDALYPKVLDLEDCLAVIDQLKWTKLSVLGHSMGGVNCMYLAGLVPNRIESVVIIDAIAPIYYSDSKDVSNVVDVYKQKKAYFSKKHQSKFMHSFENAAVARSNGLHPISLHAAKLLVSRGTIQVEIDGKPGYVWSSDPNLFLWQSTRYSASFVHEMLSRVTCPVLCLMADHTFPQTFSKTKVREILGSKLREKLMKGVPSHHMHVEPDTIHLVGQEIVDLWKEHGIIKINNSML